MKSVKNIGYKYVQISGVEVNDAKFIKDVCDKSGLKILCTHRSYDAFLNDFDSEVERHKIYDSKYAGIGCLEKQHREDKETFLKTIETLNSISDRLKEHGIIFTYHNHAWEFSKLDNKYYMDYLLEYGRFSIMADIYWIAYAGINPAKFIRENSGRIDCIHFKDLAVVNDSDVIYAEIGKGNLEWNEIITACQETEVKYVLVEQDTCLTDPMECLEISHDFLATKGFN